MRFGIVELYQGQSGEKGFYNSQEIGLARAMRKLGYDSVIFYPSLAAAKLREEIVEEGIRIVYCPAKNIGVHSKYKWDILLDYQIDVAQIGSDNQIFAPSLFRFCDKHHIACYHYIGAVESDSDNILKRLLLNLFFLRNRKVCKTHKCFVKTDSVSKQLLEKGIFNVDVVPVGLDTAIIPDLSETKEQLRDRLDLPPDKIVLLFVGRMDKYKRPFEVLSLLKELADTDSVWAVMIGTGSLDHELEAAMKFEEPAFKITWIRRIPNHDIHAYYKAADYYLNFNRSEIFGMSILEAMYHGCTVLAKHAPGPDFIIENGRSGFLVDQTSDMARIIKSGKRIRPESAKKRIEENFLWDKTAQRLDSWIKENVYMLSGQEVSK